MIRKIYLVWLVERLGLVHLSSFYLNCTLMFSLSNSMLSWMLSWTLTFSLNDSILVSAHYIRVVNPILFVTLIFILVPVETTFKYYRESCTLAGLFILHSKFPNNPLEYCLLNDGTTRDRNLKVAKCAQFLEASPLVSLTFTMMESLVHNEASSTNEEHAPKVDLKPLPSSLRYEFLGPNSTYLVIVNASLNAS